MSILYLVRHGQGGTREQYDSLSPLGRRQARLVGEYFAAEQIRAAQILSGGLQRQRETAEAACAAMREMGLSPPPVRTDCRWDEFDLTQVYRELAPQIAASDPDFRRRYEEMKRSIEESRGEPDAPIHRRWNDCDKQVVQAWIEGRYRYSGEAWPDFVGRVHAALAELAPHAGESGIVFTSATPIGIAAASTFDVRDPRVMQFAGVLFNASISTLRLRPGEVRLFTFNTTPHLKDAALRTFR